MKIEKYSRQKNDMYLITLEDNSKIKLHEDLILKYQLLLTKEVDSNLLEILHQENMIYEVYNIALKYLNTKMRSRRELMNYLLKKGYEQSMIDTILEMISKQGYLNDQVYTASFIHDKMALSSDGPNKIREELRNLGISDDIIEERITVFTEEIENERIENIINKQIKKNHNKGPIVLKRKIQMYLINLGYSNTLVNQVLNGKKLGNDNISKQEYEKLYAKLSKKYSGKELEYKLKQKMYQKGFSSFDIEE